MSSILNSVLQSLLYGGEVHDYAHAAKVFRSNDFARAPRYKWLFQVNFILSSNAPSYVSTRELSYLVKSVDLPRFTVDVKDMNQYNRKTFVQSRIRYEPVTIKFHDDNSNGLRELWQDYYTYYYADGNYSNNDYNFDDRYRPRSSRSSSAWGLDYGATVPFFSAIEIYSLAGGESNKITLMNPIISSFSHDSHDYSDGQGLMEATMQVHYMGVTYENGYAAGVPGFAVPEAYDPSVSGISAKFAGFFLDKNSNTLVRQPTNFTNRAIERQNQASYRSPIEQTAIYNPTSTNSLSPTEIQSIVNNNNSATNLQNYSFPIADTNAQIQTQNPSNIVPYQLATNASSNGENVPTPQGNATLYPPDSYQHILYNQGYTVSQITSASKFVSSIPSETINSHKISDGGITSTQAWLAQQYIDSPQSVASFGSVNYGQPASNPSNINFSNPSNPVNPTYNSQTWQQTLLSEGYTSSQVNIAANQIAQLNIAPGTNLVPVAKSYIAFNANNKK
jgi:hypothetical protein